MRNRGCRVVKRERQCGLRGRERCEGEGCWVKM